jgi:hypothetical protein
MVNCLMLPCDNAIFRPNPVSSAPVLHEEKNTCMIKQTKLHRPENTLTKTR